MADITIETAAYTSQHNRALRGGVFWTSPTVGYVIYLDVNADLVYRKTVDGGATWANQAVVVAAASCDAASYDCYADWQTADDAGTKIHIVYISRDTNEIRYVYLDTSTDTVGGDDLIETCQGTGTFYEGFADNEHFLISITKTRGGNFAVVLKYEDNDVPEVPFSSFYTSPDATTWTSGASPYTGEHDADYCILFPGNEADNQDVWAVFWDISTNEVSLKTYDDSGDSWSEQLISTDMREVTGYLQIDGTIRLSDGHLILAAWSRFSYSTSDLRVWDINGAASITAKTNVITDTAGYIIVSVFVDQVSDDIYVAYVGGSSAPNSTAALYQKSGDGGGTWDGQTAMQADAEGAEKWISCGAIKSAWGGKFQPVWFNDTLDDLFTNTDNGISIAAPPVEKKHTFRLDPRPRTRMSFHPNLKLG